MRYAEGATFQHVDAIFADYPGRGYRRVLPNAVVEDPFTKGNIVPRATSFSEDQQVYVAATNKVLAGIYGRDLAGNISDIYNDEDKEGRAFDYICYRGVAKGLNTFADTSPNLLPALNAVMVTSHAGSEGMSLAIDEVAGNTTDLRDSMGDSPGPFFLPRGRTNGWVTDSSFFVGVNSERKRGMLCSSLVVAAAIFNGAMQAHTILTEQHGSLHMEKSMYDIPHRLRHQVQMLYAIERVGRG